MMTWRATAWLLIGSSTGLALTACPLTDKYYIDPGSGGATFTAAGKTGSVPVGTGGDDGGATQDGGSSGVDTVAAAGDANTAASGNAGAAGVAGAPAVGCAPATCMGTCCSDSCVDLSTDATHCGQCGNACPTGRHCRAGSCYGWTPMAAAPAAMGAREKAAYAVVGSKLFIFGGVDVQGNVLNSGALYDKATDSWTMLSVSNYTPSARQLATAIFTGQRVNLLGGRDAAALALDDGGRYDPTSGGWLTTMSAMTTGRVAPFLAAGTTYLLVWGGLSNTGTALSGGERCYYGGAAVTDCTAINSTGIYGSAAQLPERATDSAWAATTSDAMLFGGRIYGNTTTNKGYLFSFTSGAFSSLAVGPSARWGAFAVSDGNAYFVWGGRDDTTAMSDGHRYAIGWTELNSDGAPSPRWAPQRNTGWALAFGKNSIAILGGMDVAGNPLTDGARYDYQSDAWTPIEPWLSAEAHEWGVAALIEGEILVWGGRNGQQVTATGERYLP